MNNTLTYHLTAELLASLEAEGYPLGTGKHLQVQELLRLLPKDADAETLRLALCPLLARNPQGQARVYEMFDECRKRVEAMMPIDMEGEPSEAEAAREVAEKELKKWRWRIIIPAAILVLVAMAGLFFYVGETPGAEMPTMEEPTEQLIDSIQNAFNLQPETGTPQTLFQPKTYPYDHDLTKYAIAPLPVWQEWLFTHWWWLRWALLIPFTLLLIAIWYYLEQKRRKLIAEREPKDQPPYFWNIRIEGGDEILTGESFAYALQVMRRRMGADTFALDLPCTIHATAERGGLPEFRFREQTQPVDYLLLIDRQSIQNHRARLFDTLYHAFREQEIEMARFFYDSDMRVCFNEEHPHGVGLQELQQRYGTARLLLVGTGAQLISPLSGKLAPWTSLFTTWKQRALFTPKPLADWGRLERRLPEIFTVLPATLQSLSFWVEELEDGQDARFEEWRTRVKDAPQLPIQPNANDPLPLLQLHYDTPMLQWIAACAIYPSLHWDLTLWLGRQIAVSSPQSPIPNPQSPELVSVEGLLHLFRLPWFVEGEIPAPARAALLDSLEKEHPSLLLHLRAELALLLQQSPPPQASAASDDYQMNIALNEWLTTPDERRKKELEQEVARLLAAGVEADFTVLKYLERPRTPLDFVVPDAWKKYVYPSGYRGLGWQGKWKDLLWVLPVWVLGLTALFWPWEMQLYECEGEKVEYVIGNETISICLDSPEKKVVYLEWLVRDAIQAGNIKMADSLLTERSTPIVQRQIQNNQQGTDVSGETGPPPDIDPNNPPPPPPSPYLSPVPLSAETDASVRTIYEEGDKNIAVTLFNRGVALYQIAPKDSACYYFQSAMNFDSTEADFREGVEWCDLSFFVSSGMTEENSVVGTVTPRKNTSKPIMTFRTEKRGTVRVKVCVDEFGNVISAEATQSGSTTGDGELRQAAVKNAWQWKFTPEPGADVQCGWIDYVFPTISSEVSDSLQEVELSEATAIIEGPSPTFREPILFKEYIVKSGETVTMIANRFKVAPEGLAYFNSVSVDGNLFTGKRLLVPIYDYENVVLFRDTSLSKASVDSDLALNTWPQELKKKNANDVKTNSVNYPAERIGQLNEVKVILSMEGETLAEIAQSYKINIDNILNYNDKGYEASQKLKASTRVFIQEKRSSWRGKSTHHFVREGQTMFEISQMYGVKLNDLLERNGMYTGDEPVAGEKIRLKGKRGSDEVIKLKD